MAAHEVILRVESSSPEEVVKVVEVMSQTLMGLGLNGHTASLAVAEVCAGCEDCIFDLDDENGEDVGG